MIVCLLSALIGAALLFLSAYEENIVFYVTPSELKSQDYQKQTLRIGGLVKAESVVNHYDRGFEFTVTDGVEEVEVIFQGILPGLFKEGQGVIAEGTFSGEHFVATQVLAKHDETYKPPRLDQIAERKGQK